MQKFEAPLNRKYKLSDSASRKAKIVIDNCKVSTVLLILFMATGEVVATFKNDLFIFGVLLWSFIYHVHQNLSII